MSRGGRGGRGGGRGGRAGPQLSWDNGDEPDARPTELFPAYKVPTPRALSAAETSAISHFLLLRHQVHGTGLYTSKRTLLLDPTAPRKMYGQAQRNALYGVRSRASQDPFTAMPTYSQRFVREERALPDWSGRPVCRELFPDEVLGTVDPSGGDSAELGAAPARKKRRLELSSVSALPSAEVAFGMVGDEDGEDAVHEDAEGDADEEGEEGLRSGKNALEKLEAMRDADGEEGEMEEEEGPEDEDDEDDAYDDEDAGDYDAENYFDNGDDLGDDYGDGDDGEGTY